MSKLYDKAIAMMKDNERKTNELVELRDNVSSSMSALEIGDNMYNALMTELNMIDSNLDQRNSGKAEAHYQLLRKGERGATNVICIMEYVENQSSC